MHPPRQRCNRLLPYTIPRERPCVLHVTPLDVPWQLLEVCTTTTLCSMAIRPDVAWKFLNMCATSPFLSLAILSAATRQILGTRGNSLYCSMAKSLARMPIFSTVAWQQFLLSTENLSVIAWQFLNVACEWSFEETPSNGVVHSNEPPWGNVRSCQGPPVWSFNPLLGS